MTDFIDLGSKKNTLDRSRVTLFLFLAFGISWITAGIIWLTGGLQNSPVLVPGTTFTLAFVLLATAYMWGPALAHILTRLITREGQQENYLRFNLKRGWLYWLVAWVLPGILTVAGVWLFYMLFPVLFDPQAKIYLEQVRAMTGADLTMQPMDFALLQFFQATLIAPLVNGIATFGEEYGWRAYLQPKLMPLGPRRAVLFTGLIWGIWHWPIILMGYNYGFNYPGVPWLGPLAMTWFTLTLGVIIGWLTIRGGSVWPAVIAHAAINGIAGIGLLFLAGEPNLLLGPTPVGLIALLPFTGFALGLLLFPKALEPPAPPAPEPLVDGSLPSPRLD
jgi:uncharacterized protein